MSYQTILYVDANPLNVQWMKKSLKFMPYHVLDVATGRSGLVFAQLHTPNLILIDLQLPDMDGLTLVEHIKMNARLRAIPLVAMTQDSSPTDHRALDAGCAASLNQPVSKVALFKLIHQLLAVPAVNVN